MNTDDLAEFLASAEGLTAVRALQRLGLLARPATPPGAPADGSPTAILDYHPVHAHEELVFQRVHPLRCKPKTLPAKHPGIFRVCLFGESMAAGFPLAPAYSPAIVLEALLRSAAPDRRVELIDLSRPNMGPSEQLGVCEAARQLSPDVFVFMTGNNWYYGLPVEPTAPPAARAHYAHELSHGGPQRLAASFRAALASRARVMLRVFAETARAARAQALVIIPPVNHAWERRDPPPWLHGDALDRWLLCLAAAERHLALGDVEGALREAADMEALAAGLSSTPQRLMARAHLLAGRPAEARAASLRAVDASNWHNYVWALPQVPTYVADLMRTEASELGYTCIDLDALFGEHTASPFLDFRMFYDHCHLSVEGIRVAMCAVASKILFQWMERDYPWRSLLPAAPEPTPLCAASAAFQAAHWASQFFLSPEEHELELRLRTQLRAAVAADRLVLETLAHGLRLKGLSAAPELVAQFPIATRMPGAGNILLSRRLNPAMFAASLHILREHGNPDVDAIVEHVIATYEAAFRDGLDISHSRFCEWFWERTPRDVHDPWERHGAPFYRAYFAESRFAFLAGATRPLDFEVVARSRAHGTASLLVNGEAVATLALGAGWQTFRGSLAPQQLRHGLNRVRIVWPTSNLDADAALAEVRRRFGLGADADLFPIFGEIYALKIRAHA